MAACGNGSTVAVTEDGELLAWGDGQHGELGLGAVLHQHQPARVGGLELFANQRIRQVAAGYRHLAVVAEDGAVYTCGDGFAGQLGLGNRQPRRQRIFAGGRRTARGREDRDGGVRMLSQRGGVGGGARVDLWLWNFRHSEAQAGADADSARAV